MNESLCSLRVPKRHDESRMEGKHDFTIIVGDQKIHAEQKVLASGSDYFNAMLFHDTEERQKSEVEMLDVDFESVETCINYIYGREVSVNSENFENLMFVAHMMQLDELCHIIEENMAKKIDAESFLLIGEIAIMFGCRELIKKCQLFIERKFTRITKVKKFEKLKKSLFREVILHKNVRVDEERKLEAILKWVKIDNNRRKDLLELIQVINISQIPHDIAQSYIKNEPLINTNKDCLLYFSLAVLDGMMSRMERHIILFDKNDTNLRLLNVRENTIQKLSFKKPEVDDYSVVSLDDYVYILSENKFVQRLKYSDKEAIWENIPNTRENHGAIPPAAVLDSCIYVIGGHNFCITSSVERYDPVRNEWIRLENKTYPIACAAVVAFRGFIYSFGGYINGEYVNVAERLDVLNSQWQTLCPMNEKKEGATAAEGNNFIYVTGGWNGKERLRTLEKYHPSTDQWTILTGMNIERSWFNMFAFDKCLYVVGGDNRHGQSIERYECIKDKWRVVCKDNNVNITASVPIAKSKDNDCVKSFRKLLSDNDRICISLQSAEIGPIISLSQGVAQSGNPKEVPAPCRETFGTQ